MSVNVTWHEENPMPERPCRMVRVLWHARHALECGCRTVPTSIREEVEAELLRFRSTEANAFGYAVRDPDPGAHRDVKRRDRRLRLPFWQV